MVLGDDADTGDGRERCHKEPMESQRTCWRLEARG
jgi:hypothetical protein